MGILWCTYTTPIFVKPQNPSSEGTFHQPQEMELQRALAASMKTAAQEPGIWQVGIDMFNHQQFHWWNINISKISIWCQNQTKISGWWFGTFFMFPYIGNSNPNWRTHCLNTTRLARQTEVDVWHHFDSTLGTDLGPVELPMGPVMLIP